MGNTEAPCKIDVNGVERSYTVSLPPPSTSTTTTPPPTAPPAPAILMMCLHGGTGTAQGMRKMVGSMFEGLRNVVCVYPDGQLPGEFSSHPQFVLITFSRRQRTQLERR